MLDGRGGNNTLILNEPVVVDLGQTADQTLGDTLTVLNFNNVFGSLGNNTLIGNEQANLLVGNDGDDVIIGVAGDNTLIGGNGVNTIQGGKGDDLIIGNPGDFVSGGNGIDTFLIDRDEDITVFMPDDVEVLITGKGDNFITGSLGRDSLISTGGQNTIKGGGDTGNFFSGGPGADLMIGGAGPDTFVFDNPEDGEDTLVDFDVNDLILISADGFGGNLTPGVISPEQFVIADSGSTEDHRFILQPESDGGILFYDPDGDGPQPQIPLAFLENINVSSFFNESNIIIF